ncbi:Rv3235 family protein [Allosalinactinospora lopnorensis]|uniref:Rv3235 family protein n=1 Tax=Allosalinactinospora lopnorensis TaxID=1352348 RepID=UPI000696DA35|nr:Rv3235 family protein [Allosalinactinospora lopnorensis]
MACDLRQSPRPLPARRHAAACPARPRTPRTARELCRFTQLIAEVLAGQRNPAQMRSLLSRGAYVLLLRRSGIYVCARSPRVRATYLHSEGPEATEVNAVVDCGNRYRALALRVAFAQHTWLCTHLETDVGRG